MAKEPHVGKRAGPPHKPALRELIADKRLWSLGPSTEAQRNGFRGWHERGYLPHRDEPGLIQLITFMLADAFPRDRLAEWGALLQVEDNRERRRRLEAYLDRGRGAAVLRQPAIASLVDEAVRFYHGRSYDLRAWVVMPNHVHVLLRQDKLPLRKILADLKGYTAREANKILGRRGHFWAVDFWDTYMRDEAHELRARRYVENNPVKAFLVRQPRDWPWGSARFRDEGGRLNF